MHRFAACTERDQRLILLNPSLDCKPKPKAPKQTQCLRFNAETDPGFGFNQKKQQACERGEMEKKRGADPYPESRVCSPD